MSNRKVSVRWDEGGRLRLFILTGGPSDPFRDIMKGRIIKRDGGSKVK